MQCLTFAPTRLDSLLEGFTWKELSGTGRTPADLQVSSCSRAAQTTKPDGIFVALTGTNFRGQDFIPEALRGGAKVIISDSDIEPEILENVQNAVLFQVEKAREFWARVAGHAYGFPAQEFTTVGITGTNGKTTVQWYMAELFQALFDKCLAIGTLGFRINGEVREDTLTSPDAGDMNRMFRIGCDEGVRHAALEVSSMALDQARVYEIPLDVAVFMNLTRDHIDYHKTVKHYAESKFKIFELLRKENNSFIGKAVICLDDEYGTLFAKRCKSADIPSITFGFSDKSSLQIKDFQCDLHHSTFTLHYEEQSFPVKLRAIGEHNALNAAAAFASAMAVGIEPDECCTCLASIGPAPGRLEPLGHGDIGVYVDYAHTPDALLNVLKVLKPLCSNRLTVVFGCGGDRDRGKRPIMGQVARDYGDRVIVTSDNPRNEDPLTIIHDIISENSNSFLIEVDRTSAIRRALEESESGDIVLIAGKGHEDYQIIGEEKIHLCDREEVRKFWSSK